MTDLITRARKEWLEVHKSPEDAPDGEAWHYTLPCPPEVVAALLNALEVSIDADGCPDCGRTQWQEHSSDCRVAATYRAIEKALEEK